MPIAVDSFVERLQSGAPVIYIVSLLLALMLAILLRRNAAVSRVASLAPGAMASRSLVPRLLPAAGGALLLWFGATAWALSALPALDGDEAAMRVVELQAEVDSLMAQLAEARSEQAGVAAEVVSPSAPASFPDAPAGSSDASVPAATGAGSEPDPSVTTAVGPGVGGAEDDTYLTSTTSPPARRIVDPTTVVPPGRAAVLRHTVRPGESVGSIADDYRPAGIDPAAYAASVLRLNGLGATAVIFPGQVLLLPQW